MAVVLFGVLTTGCEGGSSSPSGPVSAAAGTASALAAVAAPECIALPGERCCDARLGARLTPADIKEVCAPTLPYEGESAGGGCWRWFGTGPGARHAVVIAEHAGLPLDDLRAEWVRLGASVLAPESLPGAAGAVLRARRTTPTGPTAMYAGVFHERTIVVEADRALCDAEAVKSLLSRAAMGQPGLVVPAGVF